jgi:hypothetical protein
MSANRSVQAAQRRRAGPSNAEPGVPGRSPQPSINSAQMFANQARPGQGPNIPTGRLAGQQAAMQQQQMQQQSYQQGQKVDKLSSVSKMTIPQAITLITLRLGALESKMMNSSEGHIDGDMSNVDTGILHTIIERLNSLENSPTSSDSTSSHEVNLLKQQFETVKQAVVQNKNSNATLSNQNGLLKTQIDNLRKELKETKELLATIQNLTLDNSQKILDLSNTDYNTTNLHDIEVTDLDNNEQLNDNDNEFIGTDLKQLIENELSDSH